MGRFANFNIWRGRLPHWRADDVVYFVTFRHRRELDEEERLTLFRTLAKLDGRKFSLRGLLVVPERTELLLNCEPGDDGAPTEFSDSIEKAKVRAGKLIIKKTGERFPPFYGESFDRIVRDEAELEEKVLAMVSCAETDLDVEGPEDDSTFWLNTNEP